MTDVHPAPRPSAARALVVALGAWLGYTAVTVAVQATSGVPYARWFSTAASTWRVGVASLAAGSVFLVALLVALKWDGLWRDRPTLPTSRWGHVAIVAWSAAVATRLAGVRWDAIPTDLLLAIVVVGVLVGFAEELLFRGIVLRALRAAGRSEGTAAVLSSAAFGLFHLPNVFMGTGWPGLAQLVLAALGGMTLYTFRRRAAWIVPGMVAHGAWDVSTFLSAGYARPWLEALTLPVMALMAVLQVGLVVGALRHDRTPRPPR